MASVKHLMDLLNDLESDLMSCVRCGMCQAVCPLYEETRDEVDVARGKLAILDGLRRKLVSSPPGVSNRLNRCLICGSCMENCPSEVKTLGIFFKARAILSEYGRLSPVKKRIFRFLVTRSNRFDFIFDTLAKTQKFFMQPVDFFHDTYRLSLKVGTVRNRNFPFLSRDRFTGRASETSGVPQKIDVTFYVGCLIDRVFPGVAEDVLKVLNYFNVSVRIPERQLCCGMPALSVGDIRGFCDLVKSNVEMFLSQDTTFIVTACATCCATIKKFWPLMISCSSDKFLLDKVNMVSERVLDISQFIVDYLGFNNPSGTKRNLVVTYHDPCHLRKSLGVYEHPRRLLGELGMADFVEMEGAERCCGFGGTFGLKYPEESEKIGMKKVKSIVNSGASVVTTSCPACMMQLKDMLSRAGVRIAVKHIVSFIAEGILRAPST